MSTPDLKDIEAFLYREAAFLDRPDLDQWLQLYSEDGSYWMPAMEDQPDPLNYVSHMYDDRVMMEIRKRNFVHPRAASKDSGVRCSHIISNVRILGRGDQDAVRVGSNFQVVMWYRDEQRVFAGTYEHHLIENNGDFLILHKKVELINPEAAHKSIIIYL